jgi:hypothetical protein
VDRGLRLSASGNLFALPSSMHTRTPLCFAKMGETLIRAASCNSNKAVTDTAWGAFSEKGLEPPLPPVPNQMRVQI